MVQLGYQRCLACRKGWVTEKIAKLRVKFVEKMLAKYPNPEDWYNIQFLDKVHLGFGPAGRIYVTRKPGEVNCPDCMQHENAPKKQDKKKVHAWSAIGKDFKAPLHFYNAGNSNGAMIMTCYLDLLKKEVANWPKDWVLKEDGATGHGKDKDFIITKWKKANNISYYFNCLYLPDLALIQNA